MWKPHIYIVIIITYPIQYVFILILSSGSVWLLCTFVELTRDFVVSGKVSFQSTCQPVLLLHIFPDGVALEIYIISSQGERDRERRETIAFDFLHVCTQEASAVGAVLCHSGGLGVGGRESQLASPSTAVYCPGLKFMDFHATVEHSFLFKRSCTSP